MANPYVQLLYQALASEHGIVVSHENPQSARSQFYAARKRHGDPALNVISVTILEGEPNKLYLVKPCPEESPNPSAEPTSGSSSTTSDGSETPTDTPLELPRLSELLSTPTDKR